MKPKTFRYLVKEGLRGISRHRGLTFTAIITMTASLMVLGLFLVTTFNVRQVIAGLEDRKEVVLYLEDGLDPERHRTLEARLDAHSGITGATFVGKEEAWAAFQEEMQVQGLGETVGGNPLPDAYRLDLAPDADDAASIQALAFELSAWDGVEEVLSGGEWVGRLDQFAHTTLWLTLAIGIAVGLSIIAIVSNTVRLTVVARRDLVHVMKMVGASEGFIRVPFLSEGVIQALLAGLIALGLLALGTWVVTERVSGVSFLSPLWCLGFLGVSVLLGLVGSALSVRHVLRQVGL